MQLEEIPKLVEELLQPIEGSNPSGTYLRHDPLYDSIKEARREDDNLNQGAWQTERKVADIPKVISLTTTALKKKTKDLQIAVWLTHALLRRDSYAGLAMGIQLCHGMLERFWETMYPPIEEDDLDLRAAPLSIKLEIEVKQAAINQEDHNWFDYNDSRGVPYEDQAKDPATKKKREKLLAEKKLAPEVFDKAFRETPKVFYATLEKALDEALASLKKLTALCDEKFGDSSPSFGKLETALNDVRHVVHSLLDKKRETEPDPVVEAPPVETEVVPAGETAVEVAGTTEVRAQASLTFNVASTESASQRELVGKVAAVAATLRQREPYNPAPYLMLRGLRWGELRMAAWQSDPALLEAPPTEVRQHIKRLSLDEKWKDLLEAGESVMALPCSRAWLDLQRFVVQACVALGRNYDPISMAIRSELRCLLRDIPQLLEATLMDDTPAANHETRTWLREIVKEPAANGSAPMAELPEEEQLGNGWPKKFVDSFILAKEALRLGQADKALDIMSQELARQRSARGRFQRRIQFVELCVSAGKEAIVQPMLEDLVATIDAHKLEEWEDKTAMASALLTVMRASKKIQGDAKEKQKFFERICRLDPVQALNC